MQSEIQLYLASSSPRRRELLAQLRLPFAELTIEMPEVRHQNEPPIALVTRMAEMKAQAGWLEVKRTLALPVLAADTIVVIDNEVLGKPRDKVEGINMLRRLSGQQHTVFSAVAVQRGEYKKTLLSTNLVSFRELTDSEINAYWHTEEPGDKAGGYAIQGLAAMFITHLAGSYSGVMGLPLFETAKLLNEFGIVILNEANT